MQIKISSIHFTADEKLEEFISKKVNKLSNYFDRIESADVKLRLENSGQVRDKVVEIVLNIPGNTLFSKESDKSFEKATDEAVDHLRRQIKKYKDKIRAK